MFDLESSMSSSLDVLLAATVRMVLISSVVGL